MSAVEKRLAELRARERQFEQASEAEEEAYVPLSGRPGQRWGRERILEALRRFYEQHGRPPTTVDWLRSGVDNPAATTVRYHFGTWMHAIEMAGLSDPEGGPSELHRVKRDAEARVDRLRVDLRRALEEADAVTAALEHMADLRNEE